MQEKQNKQTYELALTYKACSSNMLDMSNRIWFYTMPFREIQYNLRIHEHHFQFMD